MPPRAGKRSRASARRSWAGTRRSGSTPARCSSTRSRTVRASPAAYSEAALATRMGLNAAAFAECMKDPAMAKRVDEDFADGAAVRISGTPTTLIRDNRTGATEVVVGARPADFIAPIIERALGATPESAR
ncbi:MAG: DsbA family protein [Burkholderiales bacterium]|nr:DsbA family protein [Burkholderiales bacterium]